MSFRNSYGWLDRCLHRMAFALPGAQLGVADLETKLYRRELDGVTAERPLFVTGLPRSGTTILLELLSRTSSIATHTYRDMPFVLAPLMCRIPYPSQAVSPPWRAGYIASQARCSTYVHVCLLCCMH